MTLVFRARCGKITFTATRRPVLIWRALQNAPLAPSPILRMMRKSSSCGQSGSVFQSSLASAAVSPGKRTGTLSETRVASRESGEAGVRARGASAEESLSGTGPLGPLVCESLVIAETVDGGPEGVGSPLVASTE